MGKPVHADKALLLLISLLRNMKHVKSWCGLLLLSVSLVANSYAAQELTASWYSVASLKKEGTWKTSRGVMANGKKFNDDNLTCATRLYPLGSRLRITNLESGETVIVKVTDRIGKRFARIRIDLSRRAFREIADLEQGLVSVTVERIK